MKRLVTFAAMMLMISTVAMAAKPKFSVKHVEPLSWWVGMNTPLQLMINGEAISEYEVDILPAGQGVAIRRERRATAMLTPWMPCGAKIPVISLFAGMVVGIQTLINWISGKALEGFTTVLLLLLLLGGGILLGLAKSLYNT